MREAVKRIRQLLQEKKKGIRLDQLQREAMEGAGVSAAAVTDALHLLARNQAIRILAMADGGPQLVQLLNDSERKQSQNEAERLRGLTDQDRLVLQEIKKSGVDAITTKDLRFKSGNLPQQQLTKILKELEMRKLIKPVKSVNAGNVKKYMLYELVPSKEITGGPWYHEGEFDYGFINELKRVAEGYLAREHMATLTTFYTFIRDSGIIKGHSGLKMEHVESVLQSLVYDAKLQVGWKGARAMVRFEADPQAPICDALAACGHTHCRCSRRNSTATTAYIASPLSCTVSMSSSSRS
uniref:DNA-directed RNA polymerase III subunit RPC6 n=1 Tax=Haptolina brevifila TaxID=156173 RepID=A0A7S2E4V0_9EUKA